MARQPILPTSRSNPTGVERLERGAMREFRRRMRRVRTAYIEALERIPAEPVVNRRYEFLLDPVLLSAIFASLDRAVDEILIGSAQAVWLFEQYVKPAYRRGTAQEYANLAQQSRAYRAERESLQNLVTRVAYQRREALVEARVFEEMKGLSGQVKADMGRVLSDGVGRGQSPRDIARRLTEQVGIEERRANRIARTEVTTALRRARMDESDDAEQTLGIRTK